MSGPTAEDRQFMEEAVALAARAASHGNEPFGAVLVREGQIVCTSENRIYTAGDPTAHAELELLRRYFAQSGRTDLRDCTLYSSCEPCFMCCGAMVWARLGRLVYGAADRDLGQLLGEPGSDCARLVFGQSAHRPEVLGGVLREESLAVLARYFACHEKG